MNLRILNLTSRAIRITSTLVLIFIAYILFTQINPLNIQQSNLIQFTILYTLFLLATIAIAIPIPKAFGYSLVIGTLIIPMLTLAIISYVKKLGIYEILALLIFFIFNAIYLPILGKKGGLKIVVTTIILLIIIVFPSFTLSLTKFHLSVISINSIYNLPKPFISFIKEPMSKVSLYGIFSTIVGGIGYILASLRKTFTPVSNLTRITIPVILVSAFTFLSYNLLGNISSFYGLFEYNIIAIAILSAVLLAFYNKKNIYGLIISAVSFSLLILFVLEMVFSLSFTSTYPFLIEKNLPLSSIIFPLFLITISGIASPRGILDPISIKKKLFTALSKNEYGKAGDFIYTLRSLGISETDLFCELINKSRNCNSILWMQEKYKINYSKCSNLRGLVDCIMYKNRIPRDIDVILDILYNKDLSYAEKLAGFVLSKGTKDYREEKAKTIIAKILGNTQTAQNNTNTQVQSKPNDEKTPPLEKWDPNIWVGREIYGYKIIKVLGNGGTSYVLLGSRSGNNQNYAIKIPKLSVQKNEATRASFTTFDDLSKESSKLQEMSEKNNEIVKVYGTFVDVNTIKSITSGNNTLDYLKSPPAIVMELMEGGTLNDLIKNQIVINSTYWTNIVKLIFLKVGYALSFIHAEGYVHLDVKPANIFFNKSPGNYGEIIYNRIKSGEISVKLGDLGSARKIGERFFEYTPEYCPVDQVKSILFGKGADPSMDVYAFGASLYKALTGYSYNPPEVVNLMDKAITDSLSGRNFKKSIEEAENTYATFYSQLKIPDVDFSLQKIIISTVNPDPLKRPKMKDIIKELST
ncbi:protein kinase domain-containing protein [Acidianus brierleyi]|uniref:protein kinase domain-containing protein n=1 Tax=Acidianus brierleyi TaxID=41673 RepID=UPI00144325A5|nr:protein kinase [Acidianus brierleyi]AWR94158.2 protein kinase [Acidianus brierleyi]